MQRERSCHEVSRLLKRGWNIFGTRPKKDEWGACFVNLLLWASCVMVNYNKMAARVCRFGSFLSVCRFSRQALLTRAFSSSSTKGSSNDSFFARLTGSPTIERATDAHSKVLTGKETLYELDGELVQLNDQQCVFTSQKTSIIISFQYF